eukprot:612939_1
MVSFRIILLIIINGSYEIVNSLDIDCTTSDCANPTNCDFNENCNIQCDSDAGCSGSSGCCKDITINLNGANDVVIECLNGNSCESMTINGESASLQVDCRSEACEQLTINTIIDSLLQVDCISHRACRNAQIHSIATTINVDCSPIDSSNSDMCTAINITGESDTLTLVCPGDACQDSTIIGDFDVLDIQCIGSLQDDACENMNIIGSDGSSITLTCSEDGSIRSGMCQSMDIVQQMLFLLQMMRVRIVTRLVRVKAWNVIVAGKMH